jgi:hypothetical protein
MNMLKNLSLFFGLIIVLLLNLKCLKDEIDENGSSPQNIEQSTELRSGFTDVIFYRTSLTTDNFLLTNAPGTFRTYLIFNKVKITNIIFNASGQGNINVNGVVLKHYKIKVNYIDNTTYEFSAFSKSSNNTFTFIPNGDNQLFDQHSAKFIEIKYTGRNQTNGYNFWRDNIPNLYLWEIKKDGTTLMVTKILEPLDKTSNIFTPKHQH